MNLCQCPLGLIPHFYVREAISSSCGFDRGVNALSGLYLISTFAEAVYVYWFKPMSVNALSGLYLISTQTAHSWSQLRQWVSMPSRAYTSFLRWRRWSRNILMHSCQCPLGLIPHFYKAARNKLSVAIEMCQCPLGLIPHFYWRHDRGAVMLRVVSMPSRAYTSFLQGARYGKED